MFQSGQQIGRYQIVRELGRGGMGTVYLVVDDDAREFALKIANPDAPASIHQRFVQEVKVAKRLQDLHLVMAHETNGFYDSVANRQVPYIVLEYLVGETLEDMIATFAARGELIPAGTVVAIARQVAAGLHRAHSKAIVHRDIKPSNIFVCHSEAASIVKLIDFGLALIQRETMVEQAQPMLSPPYAPPEQWHRWEAVDDAADTYAFGATLYELLTGAPPFGYAGELHAAHAFSPVPSVAERRKQRNAPPVSPALASLVERMLAKRPNERPPLAEIRQVLETAAMAEPANSSRGLRVVDGSSRGRWAWFFIAAGVATLIGLGVVSAIQPDKKPIKIAEVPSDAAIVQSLPPPPPPPQPIDAVLIAPDAREDVAADGARFHTGDHVFHKLASNRFVHGRLESLAEDSAVVDGSETKLDDLSPADMPATLGVGTVVLMPATDDSASYLGRITSVDKDSVGLRYLDGHTLKSVSFSTTASANGRLSRPVKVRESWQAALAPLLDPPPVPRKQSSSQGCTNYCEHVAGQQPGTDGFTRCMSGCN